MIVISRAAIHSGGTVVVGAPGVEVIPGGFKLAVIIKRVAIDNGLPYSGCRGAEQGSGE